MQQFCKTLLPISKHVIFAAIKFFGEGFRSLALGEVEEQEVF